MFSTYYEKEYFMYEPTGNNSSMYQLLVYKQFNVRRWWAWFRDGFLFQPRRKKLVNKQTKKSIKSFWLRILPSKSGWVGKVMARKKRGK
jgi:hypothetical protein